MLVIENDHRTVTLFPLGWVGAMLGLEKHGSCVWNLSFEGTHLVIPLFVAGNRWWLLSFQLHPLKLTWNRTRKWTPETGRCSFRLDYFLTAQHHSTNQQAVIFLGSQHGNLDKMSKEILANLGTNMLIYDFLWLFLLSWFLLWQMWNHPLQKKTALKKNGWGGIFVFRTSGRGAWQFGVRACGKGWCFNHFPLVSLRYELIFFREKHIFLVKTFQTHSRLSGYFCRLFTSPWFLAFYEDSS